MTIRAPMNDARLDTSRVHLAALPCVQHPVLPAQPAVVNGLSLKLAAPSTAGPCMLHVMPMATICDLRPASCLCAPVDADADPGFHSLSSVGATTVETCRHRQAYSWARRSTGGSHAPESAPTMMMPCVRTGQPRLPSAHE
jgi:hypothetical protein